MEKVKEFLKKIPDWVKAVVASAVIIAVAVVVNDVVTTVICRNISDIENDNFSKVFQIDSIDERDDKLVLEGWVFKLNSNADKDDFDIVLYDYNKDKFFRTAMKDAEREDVNNYFLCEYDYTYSGFIATINSGKLNLETDNYEILVQEKGSRKAASTGIYIVNGEIMYVKPEDYVEPKVEGTELESIVRDGKLRVYRPDEGMYVYQYGRDLYWIVDENYYFEEDGSTYVQYQLWTTQPDKLPKERLDYNLYWDNKSFNFEVRELKEKATTNYRVAIAALPQEYSVTRIYTGNNVEDNMWRQDFRPVYEFD